MPTESWDFPQGRSAGDSHDTAAASAATSLSADPGHSADVAGSGAGRIGGAGGDHHCQAQSGPPQLLSSSLGDGAGFGTADRLGLNAGPPSAGRPGVDLLLPAGAQPAGWCAGEGEPGSPTRADRPAGGAAAAAIAAPDSIGTDSAVQTYNDHIKATHQLAALGVRRTLPSRAPETITATVAAVPAGTPVVAVAFKPTSAPALDGVQRVPAFARCDDQHRVNVGKPTAALGWAPGDALVATCDLGRVTVVAAARTCPAQQPVTLDGKGRLRVSPAAAAVLRLDPDAHVLAIAVPATGQLVLMPAGPALAALTGPVTVEAPASAAEEIPGTQPRPGSNVRARFRPQVVA